MAEFGPFGPAPHLAAGVSGGADSMALAVLAASWARQRGGGCIALIVDHGLRPESGREAAETAQRLAELDIPSRVIRLGLPPGAGLQARARAARHAALAGAAHEAGIVHLLLGHHAGDQGELRVMRARRGVRGLAGMAGVSPRDAVLILRPLLGTPPAMLRDFLARRGIAWVEDPSNADPRFERVRVRLAGALPPPGDALAASAARATAERISAADLARDVTLRPEGWAIVRADALPPDALAALLRVIAGEVYPPARAAIARLAGRFQPATLGGVRIMPAGRHGPGWMLIREAASCAPPIPAVEGAVWDGRFRIRHVPPGARTLGALGTNPVETRAAARFPAVLRQTLPAFFADHGGVLAVPHLAVGLAGAVIFAPPGPAAAAPFEPAYGGGQICVSRSPEG